jgi:hypothetical protein
MNIRQAMAGTGGLVWFFHCLLFPPFYYVPDSFIGGLDHRWIGDCCDPEWGYLFRLHMFELLFILLSTSILVLALSRGARQRQKQVGFLSFAALVTMLGVWLPSSLRGVSLMPEPLIGDANVVLALSLAFMFFLRHDPA